MKQKTFKREIALLCLVWLVYIVETKDVEIISVLAWPIFSYVAAAFGFDAYGKLRGSTESPDRGRDECSSEYSGR